MSHNIEIIPTVGGGDQTVLTVIDNRGDEATVRFQRGLGINPRLCVDSCRATLVQGEDLYALRELLNEMPEEAFVRPADPIDPDLAALRQAPSDSKIIDKAGRVYVKLVSTYENLQTGAWLAESQMAARGVSVIVTPQMWKTQ